MLLNGHSNRIFGGSVGNHTSKGFGSAIVVAVISTTGMGLVSRDEGESNVSSNAKWISVVETPLPAALPLFASGLTGLGFLGWWRRRKNETI